MQKLKWKSTLRWEPYSFNGTPLSSCVSFTIRLRDRDDGREGYRHFWPQLKRATKKPQGRARYERRYRNGRN